MRHYGGPVCSCCGFNQDIRLHGSTVLNFDHINGGGNRHLRTLKSMVMSRWLINNGFPMGFRILCRGCNAMMSPGHEKCLLHGGTL
jgi:hypothetical protein